ncbi:MAG: sterol desaturase family protein [Acidobacteriota bacterium]
MVQRLVIAFVTTPLLVSAIALGKLQAAALTAWLGPGPAWLAGPWALLAFAAIGLVLSDIGHYISHYMQHKIPFFWEFHKIHHAAEVLTPVTAARVHPVENLLDSILLAPLEALELGAFFYLYGTEQSVMTIVGMTLLFPLYYLVDSIRHSHLRISFGPILEHIFSSPAQHQIHHSRAPQHLDTNFSRHLSLLDWMAGTLYISKAGETLDFGLADGPDSELNSVRSLYWVPMKRAFRLVFRPYAPPAQIVSGD